MLKQSYTEKTNGQNNDDKAKKPTLGSHSISVNYCNILAYFHVTNNKIKTLTVLTEGKAFLRSLMKPKLYGHLGVQSRQSRGL